jgi:hypothetical protein
MSRDAVGVVILSEDTQTECFIRRFLRKRSYDSRQIRTEAPVNNGCDRSSSTNSKPIAAEALGQRPA